MIQSKCNSFSHCHGCLTPVWERCVFRRLCVAVYERVFVFLVGGWSGSEQVDTSERPRRHPCVRDNLEITFSGICGWVQAPRCPSCVVCVVLKVVLTLLIFTRHYDPHSHAIKAVRHQKNKDKPLMRWKGAGLHAKCTYCERYLWINCSYIVQHPPPPPPPPTTPCRDLKSWGACWIQPK